MTEPEVLGRALDQAFDRRSWHGTNLKGSIRGMSPEAAGWKPGPGRHSIHDLVLHCAYWKYSVRRRISGEARGSFPRKGSNFFATDPGQWKQDVALLGEQHRLLRQAVAALPAARLNEVPPGSRFMIRDLVLGAAAHDLYHAGQIQLIKRLAAAQQRNGEGI